MLKQGMAIVVAAGLFQAGTVAAQGKATVVEKTAATKVLFENDKVRVTESTFAPGAVSKTQRGQRVVYVVKGGTLERTQADGKKVRTTRKAGEAVWLEPDSDVVTNVGKGTYVNVGVTLKK